MIRRVKWLALGAALACAGGAQAQNVTADPQSIAEALRSAGYKAEIVEKDGEQAYVSSGTGGLGFAIYSFGCDDPETGCTNAMFSAWFDNDAPSLEDMNMYSALRRWGRFYIDSEGDPTIEFDVDLEDGGMSPELFIDNIEYWDYIINDFQTFVVSGVVPDQ